MARAGAMAVFALALLPLQTLAIVSKSHGAMFLKQRSNATGFVRSLEFKHRLRICNAYPFGSAIDVFRGKDEKLTTETPMAFKSCQDFKTKLSAGDKLDFMVGDASAGTFSVSDLPNNDAVLLLVITRHDAMSTAVSFESHIFANLVNAQIAVIDTYKGKAAASPRIRDEASKGSRSEQLRYNSVVAVNAGRYDVVLDDVGGKEIQKHELVALEGESYVVMRTGVEAQDGESYPEELMVFPQSDPGMLHSGCAQISASLASLLVAFVALQ